MVEVVHLKEVIVPTALITGGHAGIGFECAKQLASRSRYNLVLAGRSMEQIKAAAQELRTAYGIKVSTLKLDTSSLSSVREAATEFRAMLESGEVASFQSLLCNAGGYSLSRFPIERTAMRQRSRPNDLDTSSFPCYRETQ